MTATKTTTFLNRAAVRRYAMDIAARTGRGDVITQIGGAVYADLEGMLRVRIRQIVHQHPSAFRTVEP